MKKVMIGAFAHESNSFCPNLTTRDRFEFYEGEKVLEMLPVVDLFAERGIEVIPSIYAVAESYGPVSREAFEFFEGRILEVVRANPDLDGIWMFCHGAMNVEEIGCGEYRLVRDIRALVRPDCQISLGMDLHGNIEADFAEYVNIFRCYHTAPHTDQTDTYRRTAAALARALDEGRQVSTEMVKVPMIFPGEMAATTTEPVKGLIAELDRLEAEDPAVECASLYIGFAWTDAPRTGATVAVVPARAEDQAYCRALAQQLADLAFSKRREFAFEMESYDTAGSIAAALASDLLPVCVTDMGDNPTAGTNGGSNMLLRELLAQNKKGMRALVSGICDAAAVRRCEEAGPGPIALSIGMDIDEVSRPLPVEGELVALFDVMDYKLITNPPLPRCRGALVRVGPVDIILTDQPFSFIHTVSFDTAPVQMSDYQLLVTKFGYIYPDLKQYAKRYIMANTPGESYQMVTEFEYHNLKRPVFPFDPI